MSESKQLTSVNDVQEADIPQLFTQGGCDHLIKAIKEKAMAIVPDMSTKKGRQSIASVAHKVRTSKTTLVKHCKAYTDDLNKRKKIAQDESKRMQTAFDAIIEEVRRPLTEFENKEKERTNAIKARIQKLKEIPRQDFTKESCIATISAVSKTPVDDSFQEFKEEVAKLKAEVIDSLEARLALIEKREAEEIKAAADLKAEQEKARREAMKNSGDKGQEDVSEQMEGNPSFDAQKPGMQVLPGASFEDLANEPPPRLGGDLDMRYAHEAGGKDPGYVKPKSGDEGLKPATDHMPWASENPESAPAPQEQTFAGYALADFQRMCEDIREELSTVHEGQVIVANVTAKELMSLCSAFLFGIEGFGRSA